MGAGVQLLTVGTWGQGSSCLQWVHGGKGVWVHGGGGPAAYSGLMV